MERARASETYSFLRSNLKEVVIEIDDTVCFLLFIWAGWFQAGSGIVVEFFLRISFEEITPETEHCDRQTQSIE